MVDSVQSQDSNVVELHSKTSGLHYGAMLRLAAALEMLGGSDLGEAYEDLWSYLRVAGFHQSFVDGVAKPYWKAACKIVSDVPYRHVLLRQGIESERRLTAYLLREVCRMMEG